jgi:RimJ/RimL family protein N-acetyltransferase
MIRGEKIALRLVRDTDINTLFDLFSDLTVRGDYYPLHLFTEAQIKQRWQVWEEERGILLICVADTIVGLIAFFKGVPYYDALEIGYILFDVANRNQGYTTEALALLTRYLFATQKINRLQLTMLVGNTAARRVAEKGGYQFEGLARGALFHRGAHRDLAIYSRLRPEADEF